MINHTFRHIILWFLLGSIGTLAYGQGINTEFGQNRVQYHDFEWLYTESPNFVSYFYQGGQDLGKFALAVAEKNLAAIESKLEFQLNNKIEIMVYHNISDLKQTNIGQGFENRNSGGVTPIIGNKIFVHFNGNHQDLEKRINQGIAKVFVENMVFGGSIQEIIQNAVLLNLPNWFVDGLVNYVGEDWSTEMDDKLREGIQSGRFRNFNKLEKEDAAFAGHALWHYIAENYGSSSIPNLLYLTRINRSLESGFLFVLGGSVKAIIAEWHEYYEQLYAYEQAEREKYIDDHLFKKIKKKDVSVGDAKISHDGRYLAYSTNDQGLYKVFIYDFEEEKSQTIIKKGFRSPNQPKDDVYPLLAWSRTGHTLATIFEKQDKILLQVNDLDKDEEIREPVTKFQQVLDIAFTADNRKLIISAVKSGQADLFTYFIPNTKTVQLTKDFYDDLQPTYARLAGKEGILFVSNRLDDTLRTEKLDTILPINNFDVFFMELKTSNDQLIRLTNTPLTNEWIPKQYKDYISFLSNENGIFNHYMAELDSSLHHVDTKVYFKDSIITNPTYPLDSLQKAGLIDSITTEDIYAYSANRFAISNYEKSILNRDFSPKNGKQFLLTQKEGQYEFYMAKLPEDIKGASKTLKNTAYKEQLINRANAPQKQAKRKKIKSKKEKRKEKANAKKEKNNFFDTPKKESPEFSVVDEILGDPNEQKKEETIIENDIEKALKEEEDNNITPIDSTNMEQYFFQSDYEDLEEFEQDDDPTQTTEPALVNNKAVNNNSKNKNQAPKFKRSRTRVYDLKFSIDEVVTQLDNSLLYIPYESFQAGGQFFSFPDLNAMIKIGATDLFEDYRITGGFRIPLNLNGSEYFLDYRAMKKRLDKRIVYHRKAQKKRYSFSLPGDNSIDSDAKVVEGMLMGTLSWPFDIARSVRLHGGYQSTRIFFLAKDAFSLDLPNFSENYFYSKLEYVHDNTFEVALNIRNGTRYKLFTEFYKPFEFFVDDKNLDFKVKDTGWMGIFGGDFRHYQKVHKQIIWANRVAFGKSFGTRKLLYYLGGVENWFKDPNKQFNRDTPIDEQQPYILQSIGANVRGFQYNIRNGDSYALFNSELRVPLFSYLFNSPIRSEFIRNFQLVGFFDAGTAWQGLNPFSEENRYYQVTVTDAGVQNIDDGQLVPIQATVNYFKNPIVVGYGGGVRSKLLGYFIKVDMAWGVDSGAKTPPRWFVSIGTDF